MPARANAARLYCSSRCRWKAWNAANPAQDDDHPSLRWRVPIHWHYDPTSCVVGWESEGAWHGEGCPPGCPGLDDPRGWSVGIRTPYRRGTAPLIPRVPRDVERRLHAWMAERLAAYRASHEES